MTEETAAEQAYFWMKLIQTGLALLAVSALLFHRRLLVYCGAFCLSWKQVRNPVPDGEFVERLDLDRDLKKSLAKANSPTVLVYGARGNGKSSLIFNALKGRRGIISLELSEKGHDEVQRELIAKMSDMIGFPFGIFAVQPNGDFLADLFAACPVRPVVVASMEATTTGEALKGLLVICKVLSYNRFKKDEGRQARFIVDLSSSRAATSAGINPIKARVAAVHVGPFSGPEATLYVTQRMPRSFRDPRRRDFVAKLIVEEFDRNVVTLQEVCYTLRERQPTDVDVVKEIIKELQGNQKKDAWDAWQKFRASVIQKLGEKDDPSDLDRKFKEVKDLLLKGPTDIFNIIGILTGSDIRVTMTSTDIGNWNAEAGMQHPFDVDPFRHTMALSGRAMAAVFRAK